MPRFPVDVANHLPMIGICVGLLHGSGRFFQKILQSDIIEHCFGQHTLQLGVLVLTRLRPLGLADVHAAVIVTRFGNSDAALVLLQD